MAMTVKDLRETLSDMNDNAIVVMSSDGEGNSFSPLADIDDGRVYRADTTWSGETGYAELTPLLESLGYGEEDIIKDGQPCIVLCPTN